MKSTIDIINRCERALNGAWSNAPKPEDVATLYLGASEAVLLCIEAAKENGANGECLRELRFIGNVMCDQSTKAVQQYRESQRQCSSWWTVLLRRLGCP